MSTLRVAPWLVLSILLAPAPAAAQTCFDVLRYDATVVSVDIRLELARNRDTQRSFMPLRELLRRWERVTQSKFARACIATDYRFAEAHRHLVWAQRAAVIDMKQRIAKYCREFGPFLLRRATLSIDDELRKGNLHFAQVRADQLEQMLATNPMFSSCRSLQPQVATLRNTYLPRVRGLVRIPTVAADLARHYAQVRPFADASRQALTRRRRRVAAVAAMLESPEQRARASKRVEYCLRKVNLLRSLGAGDTLAVGTTLLADLERSCRWLHDNAVRITAIAHKHNAAVAARKLRRWQDGLYGWSMWKVYRRHGKPYAERKLRDAVEWTYVIDGRCLRIRFSRSGRILSRDKGMCAAHVAHAGRTN